MQIYIQKLKNAKKGLYRLSEKSIEINLANVSEPRCCNL